MRSLSRCGPLEIPRLRSGSRTGEFQKGGTRSDWCQRRLITFYKKNVKENISPTTGHRPEHPAPLSKHEALVSIPRSAGRPHKGV
jgi:hypothetical protein